MLAPVHRSLSKHHPKFIDRETQNYRNPAPPELVVGPRVGVAVDGGEERPVAKVFQSKVRHPEERHHSVDRKLEALAYVQLVEERRERFRKVLDHLSAPPGGTGDGWFPAHVFRRRGWQVGDRARLEHPEAAAGVRPLYILRTAEVMFDAKPYLDQPRELRVVQRRSGGSLRAERRSVVP